MCRFLHRFCAQTLVRRFLCADCCVQIFGVQCADFPQIFLRRFGASEIGVPESRKIAHKISRKICCVPTACPGRGPYSISAALTRRHVTQQPPSACNQGERMRVHHSSLGPKGLLSCHTKLKTLRIVNRYGDSNQALFKG